MTGETLIDPGDLIEWKDLPSSGARCEMCGISMTHAAPPWWKERDRPGSARWVCGPCHDSLANAPSEEPAPEPVAEEVEPVIPDDVIDRLEFASPGDDTDDLTKTIEKLEHLGARFAKWFCDQPIENVRLGLKEATRLEKVRETYRREQEAEARRQEETRYDALFTTTKSGGVRLDYQAIADVFIARHDPVTFNRTIWIYVDGLYRREQGEILSFVSEVARATGYEGPLTSVVREVTAYVAAYQVEGEHPFDKYANALPLANGVLEIDWDAVAMELRPYTPEHRFTRRWPVAYDPSADPGPVHEQAFSLYVDDDAVIALYQLPAQAILQFCGAGPYKKSYIFEGPTNGGKSTYVEHFLNRLFGRENISEVSLQEIGYSRFVTGTLENRIVNRCDDLADIPLKNVGPFKTLTGGFSHNIERKHEKDYPGRITAVHCFATNMPPEVPDNVAYDSAFWGRFVYLRFNNVFEVDPSFPDRVFTPANMAGVLNRILQEAFTIRVNGRLSYDQDPSGVKETWQAAANPFEMFVSSEMDSLSEKNGLFDKSKLFRSFLAWCDENQISPRKVPGTITGFTQMIFGSGFKPVRRGKKEERERMYESKYAWKPSSKYAEMI